MTAEKLFMEINHYQFVLHNLLIDRKHYKTKDLNQSIQWTVQTLKGFLNKYSNDYPALKSPLPFISQYR